MTPDEEKGVRVLSNPPSYYHKLLELQDHGLNYAIVKLYDPVEFKLIHLCRYETWVYTSDTQNCITCDFEFPEDVVRTFLLLT